MARTQIQTKNKNSDDYAFLNQLSIFPEIFKVVFYNIFDDI